jgi:hypothetical protein
VNKVKRISLLLALLIFLSGCATYKFQKGPAPYDKGYVVSYDDKLIPEYTLGQDNSVPELVLAKERFSRRRATVEYYYNKMGQIEARLKELFWDPPAMFIDFLGGLLRWPVVAIADYRYNRNPKYKEKVDQLDEQREAIEKSRISNLKEKLKIYIDGDLAKELSLKELPVSGAVVSPQQASVAQAPAVPVDIEQDQPVKLEPEKQVVVEEVKAIAPPPPAAIPIEVKPPVAQEEKKASSVQALQLEPPVAVIIAKPGKGASPLQVNFNGSKSYSKSSKIVYYVWEFGDGDTSTKKNPLNTYWSTTYGSRIFTATLTVKDEEGQTATTSTNIEVIAK